jgi:hypothetical protein
MKDQKTDEELKRAFLANGSNFFGWNSGKNTPNILLQVSDEIKHLNDNLKRASDASTKLAEALNRITLAAVVISAIGLLIGLTSVILDTIK